MAVTESFPDEAYYDRNLIAQLAVKLAIQCGLKAGVRDRDSAWAIAYIELPTGQVSWHIPMNEVIPGLPDFNDNWDGHDLKTKRNRVVDFVESV